MHITNNIVGSLRRIVVVNLTQAPIYLPVVMDEYLGLRNTTGRTYVPGHIRTAFGTYRAYYKRYHNILLPGRVVIMQAMGILGNIQPRTVRIGVEIILGQDMESTILPMRRTVAQIDAVFFHYPGQKDRNRGLIKPPVPAYKRFLLVIRHQFPYPIRMRTSAYRTEMKYLVLFKSLEFKL